MTVVVSEGFQDYCKNSRRKGFIYFLRVDVGGFIKIGFTAGVPALRAKALQQGSPYDLRWIGQYPAIAEEERIVHERFAAYRLRREWFFPVKPVIEFIEEKSPGFDPDAEVRQHFRFDVLEKCRSLRTQGNHLASALFSDHLGRLKRDARSDFSKWLSLTQVPSPSLIATVSAAIEATRSDLATGRMRLEGGTWGRVVKMEDAAA